LIWERDVDNNDCNGVPDNNVNNDGDGAMDNDIDNNN
jgi:hypothetical protein